ncbi:hypothetical protein Purlil1_6626 [Purpureocillium lilacinum]|uniref:Uncharacterized protein n=1 Tax=Purpureocillium lilacinum TaxID=33203 RepID=A0ABR0C0C7_PURLI|nr:hypothetical protein Purlil1_6626 [Purpureocillium lilacinum]
MASTARALTSVSILRRGLLMVAAWVGSAMWGAGGGSAMMLLGEEAERFASTLHARLTAPRVGSSTSTTGERREPPPSSHLSLRHRTGPPRAIGPTAAGMERWQQHGRGRGTASTVCAPTQTELLPSLSPTSARCSPDTPHHSLPSPTADGRPEAPMQDTLQATQRGTPDPRTSLTRHSSDQTAPAADPGPVNLAAVAAARARFLHPPALPRTWIRHTVHPEDSEHAHRETLRRISHRNPSIRFTGPHATRPDPIVALTHQSGEGSSNRGRNAETVVNGHRDEPQEMPRPIVASHSIPAARALRPPSARPSPLCQPSTPPTGHRPGRHGRQPTTSAGCAPPSAPAPRCTTLGHSGSSGHAKPPPRQARSSTPSGAPSPGARICAVAPRMARRSGRAKNHQGQFPEILNSTS